MRDELYEVLGAVHDDPERGRGESLLRRG
jgi:hypothetical protein